MMHQIVMFSGPCLGPYLAIEVALAFLSLNMGKFDAELQLLLKFNAQPALQI